MEIYPRIQAEMFLAAFAFGLGAGVFRQILFALRTVLGAYLPSEQMRELYERRLPILHRSLGFSRRRAKGAWPFLVAFFGDLLFCLCCAIALILLLYHYNHGAWRISVPVLFLLGLLLFRAGTARFFARLNDFLAYGLAVLLLYLRAAVCWPVRKVVSLAKRCLLRPLRNVIQKLYQGHLGRVSDRLCRAQLALAARGLIAEERKTSNVKREDHTVAVDH